MTVFRLLRHGHHGLLSKRLAARMPGVMMSPQGRAEIEAVAEHLAGRTAFGEKIDAIYSSPLERTRETAEIVSARLALPIDFREGLLEVDYGEWTGLTLDEIRAHPDWKLWNGLRSLACTPGGESLRAVQYRVIEALIALRAEHPDQTLLIVSHGDAIRAALIFALGMPLDFYNRIEVAPASISTIRMEDWGIRILGLNERHD